jgi:hypothetical protein
MGCFAKRLTELVFPANNTFTQYHHQYERLFDDIYGYDNIKRLFRMALDTTIHPTFILLSGPPASAKTLFLQSLIKVSKITLFLNRTYREQSI